MQSSNMLIFQMYGAPVQPGMTSPGSVSGPFQGVGHPVQFTASPWQQNTVICSPQNLAPAQSFHAIQKSATSESADSHFKYKVGDRMDRTGCHARGRYQVVGKLGCGVYGQVLECTDEAAKGMRVAIKAVRSEQLYRECARREICALQRIGVHDNISRILNHFDHQGHVCIVMEKVPGGTLSEQLQKAGGYSLRATQHIAKQMLSGLEHIHDCTVVHTDIKPDNIMIDGISEAGLPRIKIVDLGSAVIDNGPHPDLIGTKEYRSPEVVLQAGWAASVDVWAMGCSIFEVLMGRRLLDFDHTITQLHMLERVLGARIPLDMIRCAVARRNQFNSQLVVAQPCSLAPPLHLEAFKITAARSLGQDVAHAELLSLLRQMLAMDPALRPTASDLQRHPFFRCDLRDVATTEAADEARGESQTFFSPSLSDALSVCSTTACAAEDKDVYVSCKPATIRNASSSARCWVDASRHLWARGDSNASGSHSKGPDSPSSTASQWLTMNLSVNSDLSSDDRWDLAVPAASAPDMPLPFEPSSITTEGNNFPCSSAGGSAGTGSTAGLLECWAHLQEDPEAVSSASLEAWDWDKQTTQRSKPALSLSWQERVAGTLV